MESVIIHKKSDDWSSESMSLSPTSSLRRHTVTPGINNKRALARKHSFTRGTASSLAKAVRPDTKPAVLDNINRKKSLKNRKQSMTTAIDNRAVFMTTTPFLLQQRRSSWSPHTPLQPAEKKSVVVLDQVPSPVMKRVTTPSKLVPADDIRAHIDPPEHPPEPSEPIEQPLPSPKIQQRKKSRDEDSISNKSVASGKIYSNKRSMYTDNRNKLAISSSEKVHRKKRSDDDLKSSVLKAADRRRSMVNFDKCSSTWQLPYNKLDTVDTAVYEAHSPLETPKESRKSLDSITDEVISIRHRRHDTEHHNHDDTQTEEDELMPGYMRRPICAACDRNVKIAASSESLNKKNKSSSSSLSSLNNSGSRRSSISRNTSPQQTMNAKRNKKKVLSVTINSEEEETILLTPTASLSFSLTSDEDDEVDEQGHDKVILTVSPRSLSPSSPIPTRTQMNIPEQSSLVKEDTIQSKEEAPKTAVVTRPIRQNYSHYDKPELMRSIQNDIYESKQRILDTLQREEIKDYENILTTQLQLMDKLECLIQPSLLLPATPEESIQITSWQTKLEYGVARMKWNMSQWMGTVVGTGDIEDQDFDIHGYTKNVVISGVCVTTEPGLLPKSLQKFYKEEDSEVICHKYVIQLSRDNRLSSFQLMDKKDWISDDTTKQCEFSCINDKGPIVKTVRCSTEFGVFERKHHCRSCGHIFCHRHSSNQLPLFVSNGDNSGEWSRVCDTCFYSRINPYLSKT